MSRTASTSLLALLLSAGVAFSACLDDGGPSSGDLQGQSENGDASEAGGANGTSRLSGLETRLGAVPLEGAVALTDSYVFTARTGPDRPMTAFEWTVPEGATLDAEGTPVILSEFVPVLPESGLTVEQLLILTFFVGPDGAEAATFRSHGMWHSASTALTDRVVEEEAPTPPSSDYWFMNYGSGFSPGDRLYIVVSVESPETSEIAFLFRPLGAWPAEGAEPAPDAEAFLQAYPDPPRALPSPGAGTGWRFPVYYAFGDTRDPTQSGPLAYEFWTDDVEVSEALPSTGVPAPGARELTLSYELPSGTGWGNMGGYYGTEAGAGSWTSELRLHGHDGDFAGRIAPGGMGMMPPEYYDNLGSPYFWVSGEGTGAGRASFSLQLAETGAAYYVGFAGFDLGATLTELLGVGATSGTASDPGTVQRFSAPAHLLPEPGISDAWGYFPTPGAMAIRWGPTLSTPSAAGT